MIKYQDLRLADILPHKAPMILLDKIIEFREDLLHTSVTITQDSLFLTNGKVPSYVSLEYMAQAIAAWNDIVSRQFSPSFQQLGFLLGTRKLKLQTPAFTIGTNLEVFGRCNYTDGEMGSFDCWIDHEGIQVASATLTVIQPKSIESL
jgi:predicted hotdog family 3-hydroxylacyl-ACP dehydratase